MGRLLGNKTTTISKLIHHWFRWYAVIEAHSRPPPANENRTKIVKFNKYLDLIKAGKGLIAVWYCQFLQ